MIENPTSSPAPTPNSANVLRELIDEREQTRKWLEKRRGRHTLACAMTMKIGPAGELLTWTCQCGNACHDCADQYRQKQRVGILRGPSRASLTDEGEANAA